MNHIPTLSALRASECQLHAFCHICCRWRVLDLDQLLREEGGDMPAPEQAKCPDCGEHGLVRVRPGPKQYIDYVMAVRAPLPAA